MHIMKHNQTTHETMNTHSIEEDDEFFGVQHDETIHSQRQQQHEYDDSDIMMIPPQHQRHCKSSSLNYYENKSQKERFYSMGYLESFESSKDTNLQSGFEVGFLQSFDIAMNIGNILGEKVYSSTFSASRFKNPQKEEEEQEEEEGDEKRNKNKENEDGEEALVTTSNDCIIMLKDFLKHLQLQDPRDLDCNVSSLLNIEKQLLGKESS